MLGIAETRFRLRRRGILVREQHETDVRLDESTLFEHELRNRLRVKRAPDRFTDTVQQVDLAVPVERLAGDLALLQPLQEQRRERAVKHFSDAFAGRG